MGKTLKDKVKVEEKPSETINEKLGRRYFPQISKYFPRKTRLTTHYGNTI